MGAAYQPGTPLSRTIRASQASISEEDDAAACRKEALRTVSRQIPKLWRKGKDSEASDSTQEEAAAKEAEEAAAKEAEEAAEAEAEATLKMLASMLSAAEPVWFQDILAE